MLQLINVRIVIAVFLTFGCKLSIIAQNTGFEGTIETAILYASESKLPFWFYTNKHQKIGENTNISGLVEGSYTLAISPKDTLKVKGGYFYRDGFQDKLARKELYATYTNNWLQVVAGSKATPEIGHGLSVTNRNVLQSQNARALPGLLLKAPKMQPLLKNISFDWGIGHYFLNDNRYVDNTWVHYKTLGLKYQWNSKNAIVGRIRHFAQWAGNSPEFGDLPDDAAAFFDVFTARLPSDTSVDNENINALGNHLGSYFLGYTYQTDQFILELYHDHLFEDGSGTRLANFPDGVWGIQVSFPSNKIQSSILYEFITTQDQSSSTTAGRDNYFRNSVYRSGWSYDMAIIGVPFITYDTTIQPGLPNISPITNNWLQAHHIGFFATLDSWAAKVKASYIKNMGTITDPFIPIEKRVNTYLNVSYTFDRWGIISIQTGVDTSSIESTTIGAGIQYSYSF